MGEWDELYRENILDHYKHPRNRGTLEHPDITYEDANPLCGDQLRIDIAVEDGRIAQIRHSGHGCSISQAAASMLCERMEGRPLEEVKSLPSGAVWDYYCLRHSVPVGPAWLDDVRKYERDVLTQRR